MLQSSIKLFLIVNFIICTIPGTAFSEFTIDAPWLSLHVSPATQISCEPDDKGRNRLFVSPTRTGGRLQFSDKRAARLLRNVEIRVKDYDDKSWDMRKQLEKLKKAKHKFTPLNQLLSKSAQKKFEKHLNRGYVAGLYIGAKPTLELSAREMRLRLKEPGKQKRQIHKEIGAALRKVRNCRGCVAKATHRSESTSRKTKAKKKCGCFTKTVPATMELRMDTYGDNGSACIVAPFIIWPEEETKNATSVEAFYIWNYQGGQLRSVSADAPPFNVPLGYGDQEFTAPSGSHWLSIGASYGAHLGGGMADCSNIVTNYGDRLSGPYYAEARICPTQ